MKDELVIANVEWDRQLYGTVDKEIREFAKAHGLTLYTMMQEVPIRELHDTKGPTKLDYTFRIAIKPPKDGQVKINVFYSQEKFPGRETITFDAMVPRNFYATLEAALVVANS